MQLTSRKSLLAPSFVPNSRISAEATAANDAVNAELSHRMAAWPGYGVSRFASFLAALALAAATIGVMVVLPAKLDAAAAQTTAASER